MPESVSRNTGNVKPSERQPSEMQDSQKQGASVENRVPDHAQQFGSRAGGSKSGVSSSGGSTASNTPGAAASGQSGRADWEERRGYPMDSVRSGQSNSGRGGLELRLGGAQLAVWLGLVLGAIVGAYFVGFFAGRYVGFETARSASVGEVAKLNVPDEILQRRADNNKATSEIYGKLGASASETESTSSETQVLNSAKREKTTPSKAAGMAQEIRENGVVTSNPIQLDGDRSKALSTEGATAAKEIDSIFRKSELGKKDEVAAEFEVDSTKSAGVKVLGDSLKQRGENSDSSVGALLEERVAKAKQEGPVPVDVPSTKVEDEKISKLHDAVKDIEEKSSRPEKKLEETSQDFSSGKLSSGKGDSILKPVLPQGYFAQVAAPKNSVQAQDVARRLKRSGFPVMIETAHVRGEDYFRVLVGPEESKVHAERLVEQLKRESYLTGTAFLRKVK